MRRAVAISVLQTGKSGAIIIEFPGDYSEVEPPVPIPNTEVKRLYADDTALVTVWENMASPGSIKTPFKTGVFFLSLKFNRDSMPS